MTKAENLELQQLSLEALGHKYAYRKLMKAGLVVGHDRASGHRRRTPLTPTQVKNYMVKTIEMRKAVEEENAKKG